MIPKAFFCKSSNALLSDLVSPECHSGAAYSVSGLIFVIHACTNYSLWNPNCLSLLRIKNFLLTLVQISDVFVDHFKSFVM